MGCGGVKGKYIRIENSIHLQLIKYTVADFCGQGGSHSRELGPRKSFTSKHKKSGLFYVHSHEGNDSLDF